MTASNQGLLARFFSPLHLPTSAHSKYMRQTLCMKGGEKDTTCVCFHPWACSAGIMPRLHADPMHRTQLKIKHYLRQMTSIIIRYLWRNNRWQMCPSVKGRHEEHLHKTTNTNRLPAERKYLHCVMNYASIHFKMQIHIQLLKEFNTFILQECIKLIKIDWC